SERRSTTPAPPPDTAGSSRSSRRSASILASGQSDRLAIVRFLTLPSARKLSRSSTAGGEFRFGTRSTYMGFLNHAPPRPSTHNSPHYMGTYSGRRVKESCHPQTLPAAGQK